MVWRGALIRRGRLFIIFSLKGGANSKRGAYLKLGANSSIYGKQNYFKYPRLSPLVGHYRIASFKQNGKKRMQKQKMQNRDRLRISSAYQNNSLVFRSPCPFLDSFPSIAQRNIVSLRNKKNS